MKNHTSVHHLTKKADRTRILLLRTLGNFLILSALVMIAKTFYDPVREEFMYAFNSLIGKQYVLVDDFTVTGNVGRKKGLLTDALKNHGVEILRPVDPNFGIVIPKINANANIIPDVDPSKKSEYLAALKKGVAHTRGTAYPGEDGHIFLFAHSTDNFWNVSSFNAVFYLLYKLDKGDEVDLYYKGRRYKYAVSDRKIVFPTDVQYLTKKTDSEFLTLQTCWPPGTTLQRLLVFAKPAN